LSTHLLLRLPSGLLSICIINTCLYCRVLPGNATDNVWVLNLIAIYLDIHSYNHSYYKFTTSLLTVLDLFCPASSSLSLISLSDPSLSVSSVSQLLKRILCRVQREHLIEQLGFICCLGNSLPMYACRVNVLVTQTIIQATWLRSRCLAMDGRSYSHIPAFSGTPQYVTRISDFYCFTLQHLALLLAGPVLLVLYLSHEIL
jgi:hypothetical protein